MPGIWPFQGPGWEGERKADGETLDKVSGKRPWDLKGTPAPCVPANGDTSVIPEPNQNRPLSSPSKRDFLEKQRKSKERSKTFLSAGQRLAGNEALRKAVFGNDVRLLVMNVATGPGHGSLTLHGSSLT